MRMKYIMVKFNHEYSGEVIAPILFPDVINHVDMMENMRHRPYRADLISAGFVEIYAKDGENTVHCFGESESLSREPGGRNKSRGEEDAAIIHMVTQGWTCSNVEYQNKMLDWHKKKAKA